MIPPLINSLARAVWNGEETVALIDALLESGAEVCADHYRQHKYDDEGHGEDASCNVTRALMGNPDCVDGLPELKDEFDRLGWSKQG